MHFFSKIIPRAISLRTFSKAYAPDINAYLLDRVKPASEIIANLLPEDKKRLDEIKLEFEFLKDIGQTVPSSIDENDLLELLCLNSKNKRTGYYKFRAKIEYKNINRQKYKEAAIETNLDDDEEDRVNYIYRNISDSFVKRMEANRLAFIMSNCQDYQSLIFDFSYDHLMRIQDQKNLAKQMAELYGLNKQAEDPFNIYLINLKEDQNEYQFINKKYSLSNAMWNTYSENIPDIPALSNKKIIYLSPDSRNEFEEGEFDQDSGIVIGAIVDKIYQPNQSSHRAKLLNIKTRRIPLERYMTYHGSKALSLLTLYRILYLAKETNGDWKRAITESIPRRNTYQKDPKLRKLTSLFNSF